MGRERLAAAGLALIATYALFFEYFPPFTQVHLWSDIASYHYPLQRFAFQALKDGRIPLWDPSIYCGISFMGNVQAAFLYPPTWLMYAAVWMLPRLPFKALEAFAFLHVWLAFLLCYMWLRSRSGKLASALGAAVFAWSGYMACQLLHPGVVGAMTWLPLALWGVDESVERRDWRPLWKVAAASALSFLAGYPAAWIASCVIVVVYALGSRRHWRAGVGAGAALAASVLLFMVQLLPAIEARSLMLREAKYGLGAYGPLTLFKAYFVGNWFDFNPGHPTYYEPGCLCMYLGIPAVAAIAWAIGRHRLRPYLQPLLGAAVALLLANPPLFLLRLVERVPALDSSMQPSNFYAAVPAMAALITALSLDDFLRAGAPRSIPAWAQAGCVVALAGWAFHELWIWHAGGQFSSGPRAAVETAAGVALFCLGIWCVRGTAGRRRIMLAAILLLAVGTDYKVFVSGRWFNAIAGDVDEEYIPYGIRGIDDDGYRAMWRNRQYRVVTDGENGPGPLEYRLQGLATPEGFDPFLPLQYKRAIEHWTAFRTNRLFDTDLRNEDMMQALGVRYVLARKGDGLDPLLAASPNFRLIGRWDIFCHTYEYVHARPPYRWEDGAGGTVGLITWEAELREFRVASERGGRFVLAEQFFPGWEARVDERPVAIERWGGAFQSVRVGPGRHRVAFEFSPAGVAAGAAISLVSLAGLLGVVWAQRRRKLSSI